MVAAGDKATLGVSENLRRRRCACPLVPHALAALRIAAVSDREVSWALIALSRTGLAEASVRRFRDSLSSFFAMTPPRIARPDPLVQRVLTPMGSFQNRSACRRPQPVGAVECRR
jgi:hypothetical protein